MPPKYLHIALYVSLDRAPNILPAQRSDAQRVCERPLRPNLGLHATRRSNALRVSLVAASLLGRRVCVCHGVTRSAFSVPH